MWASLTKVTMTASLLKRLLNYWPPMALGPGIRVDEISSDFRYAKVSLPLRFYNRNYVATHFGGSLYSMCDPFYMLLLLNVLGKDFIVWDKAARIDYKKPGVGNVSAEFFLDEDLINSLREMKPDEKRLIDLPVDVKDDNGEVVASIVKTEYIRRKSLKSNL